MGSPETSFSFAGGEFSPEEEAYLIKKGLMWETSCGEFTDISTDLDDLSMSNLSLTSARDSLLLFEGNEQLFKELENPGSSSKSLSVSASSSRKSQKRPCSQSPQPITETEIELNASNDIDGSVSLFADDADDDKENRAYTSQDDNEEYLFEDGIPDTDDNVVVPGTQDIPLIHDDDNNDQPSSAETSMDDIDIVPCTQGASESFTSQTSEIGSVAANDSFEIVPCTQAQDEKETDENFDDSSFEISSVPCSQESVGASSSKDNLDDTITVMTKLLAMADEQEAQEILDGKSAEKSENASESKNASFSSTSSSDSDKQQEKVISKIGNDNTKFRSPLKFNRVQMLKSRKMCTPSPPRSYVDTLLKHRNNTRKINVGTAAGTNMQAPKIPVTTQASSAGVNTSTPKRTPLANITPSGKKCLTPKFSKTPVASKVDSGLRKSPFPVGLSPVANYIYSKPAPSTFARVHGIQQTSTANANFSSNVARSGGLVTRIPIPPSRVSNVPNNPKTPGSNTKPGSRHTVLRTSTYFNMTTTPPQLIKNERAVVSDGKKQFQPLRYNGTPKVKDVTGKFGSPKSEYVAQRHIGLRDESGNASFIQTTSIYKRPAPQPQQSRLVAPQIRTK